MKNLNLPLRTAQTILTITVLSLNAYVTSWYIEHTTLSMAPRATAFPIATSGCTLLILPYLFFNAPLQITHAGRASNPRFFDKWVVLFLDSVLCLLWFVAWIYEATFRAHLTLCYGHICGIMAWGAGLGAVTSFLFVATTVLATLHVVRTRGNVLPTTEVQTHEKWVGTEQEKRSEAGQS